MANEALDKQVIEGNKFTIEDARSFITDSRKKKADYLNVANRSWNEIEKRKQDGRLFGGNDLDKLRRWGRFPLWWSCWKIRQSIVFARLPEPTLKDTQGDDPYGRTACIIGERLTKGILKTFDAFPEFQAGVDDFLVTNFGWGRWYYRNELCYEDEKIRLQVIQPPPPEQESPQEDQGESPQDEQQEQPPQQPLEPIFLAPDGTPVDPSQVQEDDLGPYLLTGSEVQVDNEEVYFEAGLFAGFYPEANILRWNKCTRVAYESEYTYREFEEKFGQEAIDKLVQKDLDEYKKGSKPIIVFEYHDKVLGEVRWYAENSEDFIQPLEIRQIDTQDLTEVQAKRSPYNNSDLYGLKKFFPCTEPLIMNQNTKSFWPTPEYFQVNDLLQNLNEVVRRMMLLTKAVRVRFLFDSSVKELAGLIQENDEAGGTGVPNLQNALMQGKGSLNTLVAYFPVEELIEGLKNMYTAFQQGLDMFYQATGLSDLLRGQTSDADKTFGERQLEGKFALNRMEEPQRKVQEWIKNNYHLGMEMALSIFSDKTLDEYITPQTLEKDDQQRYIGAMQLLKENRRGRFRIDFETDSTIAINQEWRKAQAIETANAITKMMESVAKTVSDMPELGPAELKVMMHTVGELTDGKLFYDDIQEAIQETIDKAMQPKPPEFNKDEADNQLQQQRLSFDEQKQMTADKLEQLKIQSSERIEMAKLQQNSQLEQIKAQIEQFKAQSDTQVKMAELQEKSQEAQENLQLEYQKINASITESREKLANDRDALLVELRKIADKKEVDQFQVMIDAKASQSEAALNAMQLDLDKTKTLLEAHAESAQQARLDAQEMRLEREHFDTLHASHFEKLHTLVETALKHKELVAPVITEKP